MLISCVFFLLKVKSSFWSSNFTLQNIFEINFAALCFYLRQLKNNVSGFKNTFSDSHINTFVLRCVIFIINQKTRFSKRKKTPAFLRGTFVEKLLLFNSAKH